jgi:hypothetical protein
LFQECCWLQPDAIDRILNFHGVSDRNISGKGATADHSSQGPSINRRWFLASDRSSKGRLEDILRAHGAATSSCYYNPVTKNMLGDKWGNFDGGNGPTSQCRSDPRVTTLAVDMDILVVERAVFDIEMLRRVNFFIGNPASTFSWTVCLLRGVELAIHSNFCREFFSVTRFTEQRALQGEGEGAEAQVLSLVPATVPATTGVHVVQWAQPLSTTTTTTTTTTPPPPAATSQAPTTTFIHYKASYCSESTSYSGSAVSFDACRASCGVDTQRCRCFDYSPTANAESGPFAKCRLFSKVDAVIAGEISHMGYSAWLVATKVM